MVASSYDEFVNKVMDAEMHALNETEIGKELTDELFKKSIKANPKMTPEEWDEIKQKFFLFCFSMALNGNKGLMHEMGHHVWVELNKEVA